MTDFNPDEYFARRRSTFESLGGQAKLDQIAQAAREKQEALQRSSSMKREDFVKSLPSSMLTRTYGDVAKDVGVTALKAAIGLPQAVVGLADIPTGGRVGKALEEIGFRPNEAQKILSELYSDTQQAANREVQSAKGFANTVSAALDNPSVIATSIGESIPQMLGGAAVARGILGLGSKAVAASAGGVGPALPGSLARVVGTNTAPVVAGALGEGILAAGSAASQIREQTSDGLLSGQQSLAALGSGAGTAILGFAGGKLAQKLGVPDVDTMLAGGNKVTPAGFLKAVIGSGVSEGVFEEMPQSAQEKMWENYALNKPITEGVEEAAAMGLVTGVAMGGVGGGIGATQTAANAAAKSVAERAAKAQEETAKKQDLSAAIESGDISAYTDPDSPSYAPEKAVQALFGNSQKEGTTPEDKQTNFTKAELIVADMKNERQSLELELDWADPDKLQKRLDTGRAEFSPEVIAAAEETIATLRATPADPNEVAALEAKAKSMDQKIQLSESILKDFKRESQNQQVDVEAEVVKLKDVDPVVSQGAANNIINLSMSSPELVDRKLAASLVSDTTNNLTDSQRDYLRAFSEARVAENQLKTMGDVSKEIFFGSEKDKRGIKYIGLAQYRTNVAVTLAAGNQKSADRELGLLTNFETSHQAKAKAASEAYAAFLEDGIERRVVRNKDGSWAIEQGLFESASARVENGGLDIKENSPKIVANTKTEAEAISKTAAELKAAYAVKFGSVNTSGASNVENVSQPSQGVQGTASKLRDEATQEAGAGSTAADTGGGAATAVQADAATGTASVTAESKKTNGLEFARSLDKQLSDTLTPISRAQREGEISLEDARARFQEEKTKLIAENAEALVAAAFEAITPRTLAAAKSFAKDGNAVIAAALALGEVGIASRLYPENDALVQQLVLARLAQETPAAAVSTTSAVREEAPASSVNTDTTETAGTVQVAPTSTVAVSESKASGYATRTKRNVDAGDITIAFAVDHSTAGEKLTGRLAREAGKPLVKWTTGMKLSEFADQIIAALKATNGTAINVAGNGIYSWGNTTQAELNEKLFKVLGKVKAEYPALATIVSGGQTGADIAGVIAGKALGLNVDVHLPAGFLQRDANRQDYRNTQADIEKQIADGAAALNKPSTAPAVAATQEASSSAVTDADSKTDQDQLQSTEQITATASATVPDPEAQTEPAQDVEQEVAADGSGKLFANHQASPEETPLSQRLNAIADFFTQSAGREDAGSQRPLVLVKNLLSKLISKEVSPVDFLKSTDPLTARQESVLSLFQKAAQRWDPIIRSGLKRQANPAFNYKHLMAYFQFENSEDGNLDIDENLKTAMSAAVFQFIADNANGKGYSTPDQINKFLGNPEGSDIDPKVWELIGQGIPQAAIIEDLGSSIYNMLGFKANLQAPKDLEPRLKSVLGTQALRLMLSTPGLIKRKTVNAKDLSFGEKTTTKSENTQLFFYTFVRDEKTKELNPFAKRVVETNKGTGTLLNKLFGVESSITFPSLTPGAYDQKKAANSQMGVPAELYDALKHSSELPYEVHQGMWNLYSKLEYEWFSKVIGLPEGDVDTVHISQRPAHEAKTDNTFRVIDNFIAFVEDVLIPSEDGTDTKFYFVPEAWKNQRSGLTSNGVNPNAHKQHRYLVTQTAWKNKVDLTNPDAKNKLYFHLGEALGLKGTDKQIIELLDGVDGQGGLRQEPAFQAALAAMEKARQGEELTDADKAAIVDGQDMQGLNAMLAMLEVTIAERDGLDSVEVQLPAGVDGVSNGVIKGHLILGAADSSEQLLEVMNQGGIYEVNSPYSDFADWHDQPGNLDVYERATAEMNERMANMVKDMPEVTNALWAVTRPLMVGDKVTSDGRKFAKGVVPPIIFGSSFENAVIRLQENFAESVLNGFTEYANKPAELASYVKALNTLIAEGDPSAPLISEGKDGEYYLKRNLLPAQNSAIASVFNQTLGMSMQDAVETTYGPLRRQQTALINTANLTFNLYNAVLDGEREAALQSEDVEKNKAGEPIHDITREADGQIKKRLKGILPVIHSLMSKRDGRIGTGMLMSRSRLVERDSPLYKNEVQFGIPVPGAVSTITGKPVSSISSTSRVTGDVVPGAAMGTMVVHSTDSADSHNVQMNHSTLNNHDELVTGVNDIGSVAQDLNKAFFQTSLEYSPLEEVYHSLRRTVEGMARLTKSEGGLSIQAQDNLVDILAKKAWSMRTGNDVPSIGSVLVSMLKDAKVTAFQADNIRLETLSKIATVNQFAYEGQGYAVTDDDRDLALKMKTELTSEVPASVVALATELADSLKAAEKRRIKRLSDAKKAKKAQQAKQDPVESEFDLPAMDAEVPVVSSFGLLGKPRVESDKDLVRFFKSNPAATARQVIELLGEQGRLSPVNSKLLALVSKTVSPDLVVNLITKESDESSVLQKPTQASRAWFVSMGDQQAIYVLGTEFVNSGLTVESLLHELIHAAVAQVIQNPTGDAAALVAELEALRVKAQEFAKQNGLTQYTAALADVQEFVAWGMSNLGLQRDVLTKITMESKTGSNRLVTGMQKFISALTGLLFKKPDANIDNGLSVLVSNVSGLFYQAAQSKPKSGDLNLSMASQVEQINSYTTLQIHNSLDSGSVSPLFQSQLTNLLTGIVDSLHGPFGAFAKALRETEAKTPMDAWAKAKELGVAPFGSSVLAHMGASEQEAFAIEQVEATVKAALDGKGVQATTQYRELYNLYTEMYNKLSKDGSDFFKGDWAMATPSEKAHAKSQYDFVFDLKSDKDGRSDYLARFAALGLAHQGFNQMLQVATEGNVKKIRGQESFEQRLRRWFANVLGMFRERVTKTYSGQFADAKLQTLVGQLVDIEAKKRSLIQAKKGLINTAMVEDGARVVTEGVRKKIAEVADSDFMRNQKNTAVQVLRTAVSTVTNDRTEKYIEGMQKFVERNMQAQGSVLVSVLKELTGHKEKLQAAFRVVKKFEGDRQDQIAGWAKDARKAFGKKLSRDSSASITSVVMRTGLHYLSDTMSLADLERLVDNPVAQNLAIAELEAKLGHMKAEYITQIKGLGYYKATELVRVKTLMMNSHLISKLADTVYEKRIADAQAKAAEPIIKQLVSLYALKYTSRTEQALAKQVFRDENARGESVGNGIDFVMKAQKALEAEAFERQFKNNPALMVHGFTPEILNPHTEFVVVGGQEGKELEDYGYKKGAPVTKDSVDPDKSQKHIYVLKGAGLAPHVSGALQFQTDAAKGTKINSGYTNVNTQEGLENAQVQAEFNQKLGSKIETDPNWDPSMETNNYTAPLYNENGRVVNWRYLMNKQTKDELLDRNNSFDRVLGVLGGTVFSKPKIKEQNRAVLEALREIYKDDFALNAESYVEVGPNSNDPELRSFWDRLPEQTKQDVRDVWGRDNLKVTADSLDVVFGYRKRSLAEPFRQKEKNKAKLEAGGALSEADKQGLIAQNFVASVEWALTTFARVKLGKPQDEAERYAKRAAAYMTRGERAWQEVVREIKTIYVIKNVSTMVGNNLSNISQLLASGVSLKSIREHLPVALKSATAYMADTEELRELENQLETGYTQGNDAEIERKIVRLRNELAINPAREMIEAGLMPSIVEDIGEADDLYSYKTELTRKTERFTDKLNPKVKEAAKFVYMTRDGKLYKALHQATQLSDFVARYVMYQDRISREESPLSKAEAIQEASESFVNYDIAMHRNIQFMDDMGLFMFTKYFLRMQKVLLKMARENPARVLALAAADSYLNLGSIVLDSSALAKIGNNPFGIGALGFPGALDDLATVKAAMALVK